jgi:hypothetical protein
VKEGEEGLDEEGRRLWAAERLATPLDAVINRFAQMLPLLRNTFKSTLTGPSLLCPLCSMQYFVAIHFVAFVNGLNICNEYISKRVRLIAVAEMKVAPSIVYSYCCALIYIDNI